MLTVRSASYVTKLQGVVTSLVDIELTLTGLPKPGFEWWFSKLVLCHQHSVSLSVTWYTPHQIKENECTVWGLQVQVQRLKPVIPFTEDPHARRPWVWGQPGLWSELQASLGYGVSPCLVTLKWKTNVLQGYMREGEGEDIFINEYVYEDAVLLTNVWKLKKKSKKQEYSRVKYLISAWWSSVSCWLQHPNHYQWHIIRTCVIPWINNLLFYLH